MPKQVPLLDRITSREPRTEKVPTKRELEQTVAKFLFQEYKTIEKDMILTAIEVNIYEGSLTKRREWINEKLPK